MATSSSSSTRIVLLFVVLLAALQQSYAAPEQQETPVPCPIHYTRHSLDQITSKEKTPYLLGGIYDDSRPCPNCERGGLWSNFCGFRNLHKSAFWQAQVCNSRTVADAIDSALRQDNAAELLTMTPCDMWPFLRGRTTWVIG